MTLGLGNLSLTVRLTDDMMTHVASGNFFKKKWNFARFRIGIGEVDRALNDLNRAVQLDPNNLEFLETRDTIQQTLHRN